MMHIKACSFWLLIAGLLIVAGTARAEETEAQREVRARRDAFIKAVNTRDAKQFAAFFAEEVTVKAEDGQTVTGKAGREKMVEICTLPEGVTITSKIEKLEVDGDTATITATDTASFTDPQGNKKEQSGRGGETWKKIDGKWLLIKNEYL